MTDGGLCIIAFALYFGLRKIAAAIANRTIVMSGPVTINVVHRHAPEVEIP